MDPLLPRKAQDVDRSPGGAERERIDDATTGPDDRWTNETARPDPDYPAPPAGEGGTSPAQAGIEDEDR